MKSVDMLREWSKRYDNNWIDPKTGEMTVVYGTNGDCRPSGEYERFSVNEGEMMRGILDEIEREREQLILAMLGDVPDDDWYVDHADELGEHGWTRMPVDGDGEVIRIGDVLYDHETLITASRMLVDENGRWMLQDTNGTFWYDPANLHHVKPTVEDVLSEFASKVCNSGHQWGLDAKDTIADYADRIKEVLRDE